MQHLGQFVHSNAKTLTMPSNATLTMDALFSHVDHLKEWLSNGVYGSIGLKADHFINTLAHGLAPNHSRVFRLGTVLISVYRDQKLVCNASTVLGVDCKERNPLECEAPGVMPLYSADFLYYLSLAPPELINDIRMLALMSNLKMPHMEASHLKLLAKISHVSSEYMDAISNEYSPTPDIFLRMQSSLNSKLEGCVPLAEEVSSD